MPDQVFFKSDGKVYELVEVDQISLRDLITFPRDAEAVLGEPMSWAQAQALTNEVMALDEDAQNEHPMGPFVLSIAIWSSRRATGDVVTFGECLNATFEWVTVKQPGDRKPPGKAKGPKRAPAKKAAKGRPTSARAVEPLESPDQPET